MFILRLKMASENLLFFLYYSKILNEDKIKKVGKIHGKKSRYFNGCI